MKFCIYIFLEPSICPTVCDNAKHLILQVKGIYEKVGEATETALTILCEKMNVTNIDKSGMKKKDLSTICNQAILAQYKKDFTLEFSRDRKSMSVFCVPIKPGKLGPGPKMFVKVRS